MSNENIRSIINKLEPTEWEELQDHLKNKWDEAFESKIQDEYDRGYDDCQKEHEQNHLLFRVTPEVKQYIDRVIQDRIESKKYPEQSKQDVLILMLTMLTRPEHGE